MQLGMSVQHVAAVWGHGRLRWRCLLAPAAALRALQLNWSDTRHSAAMLLPTARCISRCANSAPCSAGQRAMPAHVCCHAAAAHRCHA